MASFEHKTRTEKESSDELCPQIDSWCGDFCRFWCSLVGLTPPYPMGSRQILGQTLDGNVLCHCNRIQTDSDDHVDHILYDFHCCPELYWWCSSNFERLLTLWHCKEWKLKVGCSGSVWSGTWLHNKGSSFWHMMIKEPMSVWLSTHSIELKQEKPQRSFKVFQPK